jgi:hypothetical protein
LTKGIECRYPAKASKGVGPGLQSSAASPTILHSVTPASTTDSPNGENRQEAGNNGVPIISDAEFASLGDGYIDWNDPDLDFTGFLDPTMNDEAYQYPSPTTSSSAYRSTPSTEETAEVQEAAVREAASSSRLSIPATPSLRIRSLIQRPKLKAGSQRTANLILYTLKSYPRMMLRKTTLPPFIHPRLAFSDLENNHMEPLTNCISLMHMISSGVQGSRKLFWKNVRMECEKLIEEYLNMNKWGLLAAMQALSIYILLRVEEGETDDNNIDFLLIMTVVATAKHLALKNTTCNLQLGLCNWGIEKLDWEEWIFEESRRRLSVVYRVVNMLIYFEPATMCDLQKDLVIAPLPAKKQLWEAGDEFVWRTESEREPAVRTAFGLAANGELVKLNEGQIYCGDERLLCKSLGSGVTTRQASEWEEWCSGMDGFGGLVMLAASLVA